MEVLVRFFDPPKKSYFLFGARGTGKSTWAKQYYKQAKVIDLLEPDQFRNYVSFPENSSAILYPADVFFDLADPNITTFFTLL